MHRIEGGKSLAEKKNTRKRESSIRKLFEKELSPVRDKRGEGSI